MVTFHPSATALEVRHRHELLRIESWGPTARECG